MSWLKGFAKRRSTAKGFQSCQAISQQTFILEPILTPSGIVDGGDDTPDPTVVESQNYELPDVDADFPTDTDVNTEAEIEAIAPSAVESDFSEVETEPLDYIYKSDSPELEDLSSDTATTQLDVDLTAESEVEPVLADDDLTTDNTKELEGSDLVSSDEVTEVTVSDRTTELEDSNLVSSDEVSDTTSDVDSTDEITDSTSDTALADSDLTNEVTDTTSSDITEPETDSSVETDKVSTNAAVEGSEEDLVANEPQDLTTSTTDETSTGESEVELTANTTTSTEGEEVTTNEVNEEVVPITDNSEVSETEILESEKSEITTSSTANESVGEIDSSFAPLPKFTFDSGVFTVGETGEVGIDFLFDGGGYQGELAIFSLDGMDEFEPGSAFIQEAARRALSSSEFGHVVISDISEAARFSAALPHEGDFNFGEYQGVKTFMMRVGDTFAVMLVPNGTVQQVFDSPDVGGATRPLFSLSTANPIEGFHFGQIADVTGEGNTFVMEDLRVDGYSDRDYNDITFQVRGATGQPISLDEVIDSSKDWRDSQLGQELLEYIDLPAIDAPITLPPIEPNPIESEIVYLTERIWSDADNRIHLLNAFLQTEDSRFNEPIQFLQTLANQDTSDLTQLKVWLSEQLTNLETALVDPANQTILQSLQANIVAFNPGFNAPDEAIATIFTNTVEQYGGTGYVGNATGAVIRLGDGYIQHFDLGGAGSGAILYGDGYEQALFLSNQEWQEFQANGGVLELGYPTEHALPATNDNPTIEFPFVNPIVESATETQPPSATVIETLPQTSFSQQPLVESTVVPVSELTSLDPSVESATETQPPSATVIETLPQTSSSQQPLVEASAPLSELTSLNPSVESAIETQPPSATLPQTSISQQQQTALKTIPSTSSIQVAQPTSAITEPLVSGIQSTTVTSQSFNSPTLSIFTNPNNGNRYFLTSATNWSGAQSQAVAAQSNLVAINNAAEQAWLLSTFGTQENYWIGLTDSERYGATEGNFRWVNGEPLTYTSWTPGEPNNIGHDIDGEDFVELNVIGQWNDLPNFTSFARRGIVEIANRAPIVNASEVIVSLNQTIDPPFRASDPDGNPISFYAISDNNSNATSSYITLNGIRQPTGQNIIVPISQLNTLRFVGGSTPGDNNFSVSAWDGYRWGDWTNFNLNTDTAGNILNGARQINLGQSLTEYVSSFDTNDYYRFSVNEATRVNLSISGMTADANLFLFDANGNVLANSTNGGTWNDSLIRDLAVGTYYVGIRPFNGSTTNYTLSTSGTPLTVRPQFTSFSVMDASGDDTNNTVFQRGALRFNWRTNITPTSVRAFARNNSTGVVTDLGVVNDGGIVNLNTQQQQLVPGNYSFYMEARDANNNVGRSSESQIRVLSFNPENANSIKIGDFRANSLVFSSMTEGSVFIGRGGTDTLDLSGISRSSVTSINGMSLSSFNPWSGSTNRQAIFSGNAFDYITLSDGREIYFQGIDRLRFSDGSEMDLQIRPNDTYFGQQWNLHTTDVASAWRFTRGNSNVVLTSLDSGILTAPGASGGIFDISTNRLKTTSLDDDNARDYGHGHSAVSVMASTANNSSGIAGVNWNSEVIVRDVYGDSTRSSRVSLFQAIQSSIDYARSRNQKVVFQGGIQGESWLNDGATQAQLEQLIRDNSDAALFAIAAGNGFRDVDDTSLKQQDIDYYTSIGWQPSAPVFSGGVARLQTNHSNVMAVGAISATLQTTVSGLTNAVSVNKASYSNFGASLTLMAPTDSPAMTKLGDMRTFGGTSAANPNMAGIASLVWSVNSALTGGQVRQILIDTAMDLGTAGRDNTFGNGLVNADAAVRRAWALQKDSQLANLYSGRLVMA